MVQRIWLVILLFVFSYPQLSHAAGKKSLSGESKEAFDDSYDPFADFSEFEDSSEEEADINFFRHGRFFTIGFNAGMRGFTQTFANVYGSNPCFGINLSYFFDLRFAMQVGFLTSDHSFALQGPDEDIRGTVSYTDVSLNLKYYLNTQNVTRGLAKLNPYLIGGFSQVFRTLTTNTSGGIFQKDGALGINAGAGIEIPLLRNKMYIGAQAMYQYINFRDESQEFLQSDGESTGVVLNGDSYTLLGILGINF